MRTPLSIKIAMALWLFVIVSPFYGMMTNSLRLEQAFEPIRLLVTLVGIYGLMALWWMSRWALVAVIGRFALQMVWNFAVAPHWIDRYPHLGIFALVMPTGLFAALILPNWKSLTWRPFGPSPKLRSPALEYAF